MKNVLKQFFSSIWEDFVSSLKKHYLRLLGFVVMFIVPVATLLGYYVRKVEDVTKYSIPFAVVLPLAILLIIYWGKARRFMAIKVNAMKVENSIQKGKHAGLLILCEMIQAIMTVVPFVLVYLLVKGIQQATGNVLDIFAFMIACESVGGFLCIIDTTKNVIDYEEEVE